MIAETIGTLDADQITQYAYNAVGNITETTDSLGRITRIAYSGTTKTVTDPENHSTMFEYAHLPGLPTRVTDAQGHDSINTYDALGRLINVSFNGERTHSYEYDSADNLLAETHPETGRIEYKYSDANRLTEKRWGGSLTIYHYNGTSGSLDVMVSGDGTLVDEYLIFNHANGHVSQIHSMRNNWNRSPILYDQYGNVISETLLLPGLAPKTITYTYDRNNNLERITYPDQNWAETTTNGLDMPETLSFNNESNLLVGSASYGPRKAPTSLAFTRNGTQFTASYDHSGALHDVYLRKGGIDLYHAEYEYDGAGNVIGISSTAPLEPMNASFGYDSLNRLVSATYSSGRVGAFAYEYDAYGNIKSVRENGLPVFSKDYDGQNRIIGDGYDARGNVVFDGVHSYHWDNLNRLSYAMNQFAEGLGQYYYDERGLRFMAMPPLPEITLLAGAVEVEDGGEAVFECPVGGPPVEKTFTIKNDGIAHLVLDGSPIITISGPDAAQFDVTQQPASPILPLGTSTFVIEFHPTSPGTKTAFISIANNDLDEDPFDLTLTGNLGPEMDVLNIPNGGSWDFGEVWIGQSFETDFIIVNTGRADLLLTGVPKVQIIGDEASEFSVRRQPDGVIPQNGYTYFVIRYSPGNEGPVTAEVSIENNDLDENPYTFTISGIGLSEPGGLRDENDIDITEPDGDELLVAGETRTITWTGGEDASFVRIEYSTDNGSVYSTIAARAPNTGTFDWIVPPDYSPVCLIRISDADGIPAKPRVFSLEFDLKKGSEATSGGENVPLTIRVAVPDAESQPTHAADLSILDKGPDAAEAVRLNLAESAHLDLGPLSGEWRRIRLVLNMEDCTGSVSVDGLPVLDAVPLNQLPVLIERPEVNISCEEGSATRIWLENLELRYEDQVQALAEDGGALLRPLARDAFDRYAAGAFPQFGGWLLSIFASDGSPLPAGQVPDQDASLQSSVMAEVDEGECLSPTRSFRFEKPDPSSFTVAKRFAMPARLPYALSSANFSIISPEAKMLLIKERLDAAKEDGAGLSETDTEEAVTPTAGASGGASTSALLSTRAGTYYIYTFDGRLLAEYDISGICLKDYIDMGSRLIAEYNPVASQCLDDL